MKSLTIVALVVSLGLPLLFACKNDPKPVVSPPGSDTTLPIAPASPKPEIYLYMALVDKLNLRDQPSKNGKVLTQLSQGDFVEGTGEVSTNKEEVILRNIPYKEPYYKVSNSTPEHTNGWAFSAALVPIYAGPRSTSPDLTKLSPFTAFLRTLDVKKLDSGKKALDYVAQNLSNAQGTLADATFIVLQHFLFRMETEGNFYNLTEKIKWVDADYDAINKQTFDMKKYPLTISLTENGFALAQGEGAIFPVVDWSKLGNIFINKVTPPMKNYIEQSILEEKDQLFDDGGIIIPLEQVADRAAWWEKFNQANPYFVLSEETQNAQHSLLFLLICGADNSPVFAGDAESVSDEYKKAWSYVQEKYAGTDLGRSVKEMSDLVVAEGGKRTKKVEALMQKYMEE